jgi:hypothetical protein
MQKQTTQNKQNVQQSVVRRSAKLKESGRMNHHPYLQAQGIIGNHGILSRYGSNVIQAKLTVGSPNDRCEWEADRVAKQMVRQSVHRVGPEEGELAQMKPQLTAEGANADTSVDAAIQHARGSGQPLAHNLRAPMEQAFGTDFSGVKIHTDAESDTLNRSLNARAFTNGHDIFFKAGEYNPGTASGQELIAHELTHVVQQNMAVVQRKSAIRMTPKVREAAGPSVQRQILLPVPVPSGMTVREHERIQELRSSRNYQAVKNIPTLVSLAVRPLIRNARDRLDKWNEKRKDDVLLVVGTNRERIEYNSETIKSQGAKTRNFLGDLWGISITKVNDILVMSDRILGSARKTHEDQQKIIAMVERIFKKDYPFSSPREKDLGLFWKRQVSNRIENNR